MLGGIAIGLLIGYALRQALEDWPAEVQFLHAELEQSHRIIEELEYQLWRGSC